MRGATWGEIDLKAKLWTIPATRMKAGEEHRVPLSSAEIALLAAITCRDGLVFRDLLGAQSRSRIHFSAKCVAKRAANSPTSPPPPASALAPARSRMTAALSRSPCQIGAPMASGAGGLVFIHQREVRVREYSGMSMFIRLTAHAGVSRIGECCRAGATSGTIKGKAR